MMTVKRQKSKSSQSSTLSHSNRGKGSAPAQPGRPGPAPRTRAAGTQGGAPPGTAERRGSAGSARRVGWGAAAAGELLALAPGWGREGGFARRGEGHGQGRLSSAQRLRTAREPVHPAQSPGGFLTPGCSGNSTPRPSARSPRTPHSPPLLCASSSAAPSAGSQVAGAQAGRSPVQVGPVRGRRSGRGSHGGGSRGSGERSGTGRCRRKRGPALGTRSALAGASRLEEANLVGRSRQD